MVDESKINNKQYVNLSWDEVIADYNNIKGESEWNKDKQREFNKKLEGLLENDGEKKKPGQRSPSDNPTTWWNWNATNLKNVVKGFLLSLATCFEGVLISKKTKIQKLTDFIDRANTIGLVNLALARVKMNFHYFYYTLDV